jgi:hypothetical protein
VRPLLTQTKPELDTHDRDRHEHETGEYLIALDTRKCWLCGQVIPETPNPRQMAMESQVQLEMRL